MISAHPARIDHILYRGCSVVEPPTRPTWGNLSDHEPVSCVVAFDDDAGKAPAGGSGVDPAAASAALDDLVRRIDRGIEQSSERQVIYGAASIAAAALTGALAFAARR